MNKENKENSVNYLGDLVGNELSKNIQQGSNEIVTGMDIFLKKAAKIESVGYEQAKGNLFEYIETAKLNKVLANKGYNQRAFTTDAKKEWGGFGEPHAPDDIRITDDGTIKGKVLTRTQAKVNNDPNSTAGSDKGITNPKYNGMQRNVASDKYDAVNEALDAKYKKGEISKKSYIDAKNNLKKELTDETTSITSGGTTTKELKKASSNPQKYASELEMKQFATEIVVTAKNAAVSNMIISGGIATIKNMFDLYNDKKELDEALKDIGNTLKESGIRGASAGGISGVLRSLGAKNNINILKDSNVAITMANGLLDMGISVYDYCKGEISAQKLKEDLQDTTIKSVSTIYFSKALAATFGATSLFVPFAVYTISSYGISACKAIIKEAKLNAEEYDRISALYKSYTEELVNQRILMEQQMEKYISQKQVYFNNLLNVFEENVLIIENYDVAICAIDLFATDFGLELKYVNFKEFDDMMLSNSDLIL